MTKQEYKSSNNSIYLPLETRKHIDNLNAKNKWGLIGNEIIELIDVHECAKAKNDYQTMAEIEYRLTDINFHDESRLLNNGEYGELREWYK